MGFCLALLLFFSVQPPGPPPGPPPEMNSLGVRVVDAPGGGARVTAVYPGSPAAAAGLQRGDRIVSYAGRKIAGAAALQAMSLASPAGAIVELALQRGTKTLRLRLHLAPAPRRLWPNYSPGLPRLQPHRPCCAKPAPAWLLDLACGM